MGAPYFGVIPKIDAKTSPCSAKQVASSAGGLLAVWAFCSTTSTPAVNFVCCPSVLRTIRFKQDLDLLVIKTRRKDELRLDLQVNIHSLVYMHFFIWQKAVRHLLHPNHLAGL